MFANFIYFIIVVLIYSFFKPTETTYYSIPVMLGIFVGVTICFALSTWYSFSRLKKLIYKLSMVQLDHQFTRITTRQSVLAIMVFTFYVYGLKLPNYFNHLYIFKELPTLLAFLFLGLFIFYLVIIWALAFDTYKALYKSDISRSDYILSYLSFAVPILLPWVVLSMASDIIIVLPYPSIQKFFMTGYGQFSFFTVFLSIVVIFGPALIQKSWRCKPLDDGYARRRIEALCQEAGIQYRNILFWPIFGGKMITAGVMGIVKRFRYILVTDALLTFLNDQEIDAVITHEIGHVKKNHIIYYLVFMLIFIALLTICLGKGYLLIGLLFQSSLTFLQAHFSIPNTILDLISNNAQDILDFLGFSFMIIFFVIYFRIIFGYFMRNFERQADIYVFSIFKTAKPLITTFEKIVSTSSQPPDKPNWHHFSIKERVDYLKKCEIDNYWIDKHEQKVKKSLITFFISIAIIAGLFSMINTDRFLTPEMLMADGNHYFELKEYEQSLMLYQKADKLFPNHPEIVNCLAWFYATVQDKKFKDPQKALVLALKAVTLSPSPHILDTLAESYYANGDYQRAVEVETKALAGAVQNRKFYEDQLKKFQDAINK